MTRFIYCVSLICLMPLTASAGAAVEPNETSLRAADAEELRIILAGDAHAEQAFMHPNYIVNSPANRIVRKDQLIKMLSEGKIASDAIERTIEATAITGNVGIVMGRESVKPKPTSELGQLHGAKTLERRFTDVFLFECPARTVLSKINNQTAMVGRLTEGRRDSGPPRQLRAEI